MSSCPTPVVEPEHRPRAVEAPQQALDTARLQAQPPPPPQNNPAAVQPPAHGQPHGEPAEANPAPGEAAVAQPQMEVTKTLFLPPFFFL